MRAKIQVIGSQEDIIDYTHSIGSHITITIGHGERLDGVFLPTFPQTYESVGIMGAEYNTFMLGDPATGRPAGHFRSEDLWELIDAFRNRVPA